VEPAGSRTARVGRLWRKIAAAKFARKGEPACSDTPGDQKPFGAEPAHRNRQPECVKSTGSTAPQVRRVACVVLRLAYDPHPIPGGLLPRRNLRRLSGIFPHVADREPLDLNSLLRLLRSHLECIRFRPTRQVFDPPSVASTCAFAAPSTLLQKGALPA
jgi:hypothetical protein